jgi:hypothetical protein
MKKRTCDLERSSPPGTVSSPERASWKLNEDTGGWDFVGRLSKHPSVNPGDLGSESEVLDSLLPKLRSTAR